MAMYDCEVFGYVQYNAELSYTELIECEEMLKERLPDVLHEQDAVHLDVVGLDDGLRIQFVLAEYDREHLHTICDAIAPLLPEKTTSRMLAVQKLLEKAHLFLFEDNGWNESAFNITQRIFDSTQHA
ncbi:MAG: hypothetical protein MI749_00235 [Desulfovibrionales bacterium]|nr:hypothetical protein [Desulfovibrionales bacterium]